jgi:hypothetical protein
MTNGGLAKSYMFKAEKRLKILSILLEEEDYSDVVREAQEIVELALKGALRFVGIDPPKYHDVSSMFFEHKARFPTFDQKILNQISSISKRLRKERELSFYGDIDFIPTEEYSREDALQAIEDAKFIVKTVKGLLEV